jgi:hypothetical protein
MKPLDEVRTPQDLIERAADIAALFDHANSAQAWFCAPGENRLLWALCAAGYPGTISHWNDFQAKWWPDHIRIRQMNVEAQEIVRKYLDDPHQDSRYLLLDPRYRLIKPADLADLLRACLEVTAR